MKIVSYSVVSILGSTPLVSPFVYLLGSVHDLYPLLIREQLADESRLPAPKGCNLFRRVMLLKK
jgi:hypothetical protein